MADLHEEEREPIYRGWCTQCLSHLRQQYLDKIPRGSRKASVFRQPIADFCKVSNDTVASWLRVDATHEPAGGTLLRLMCYLDLVGYEVIELQRLKPRVREFAELLGYGVITEAYACEQLEFAKMQSVYRLTFGDAAASSEKTLKMIEIWNQNKVELQAKREEAKRSCCPLTFEVDINETSAAQSTVMPYHLPQGEHAPQSLILGATQIVNGLICMLDILSLETLPAEEVASLEAMVGSLHRRLCQCKSGSGG